MARFKVTNSITKAVSFLGRFFPQKNKVVLNLYDEEIVTDLVNAIEIGARKRREVNNDKELFDRMFDIAFQLKKKVCPSFSPHWSGVGIHGSCCRCKLKD